MDLHEILKAKYDSEWWEYPELMDQAPNFHNQNLLNCNQALEYYQKKDRPITILVVHGSGRSSHKSCAHERSNSQLLLEYGLSELENEFSQGLVDIDIVNLRDYSIEPCNACFLDPQIRVLTKNGWLQLIDIERNNFVLSHRKLYRKVTSCPRPIYGNDIVILKYKNLKRQEKTINVTSDHKFLIGDKWVEAKDLKVGDKLSTIDAKLSYEITFLSIELLSSPIKTYCLTVEHDHSFVIQDNIISHNCVSTASALCGYPCNCFPLPSEGMQQLYPKVLRSDVLLISTPVNQSMISTRLKAFLDRLISLDGGFLIDKDQYRPKDSLWRSKMIELSLNHPIEYSQRLYNKSAAYFLSGKDINNPFNKKSDYIFHITKSLWSNFDDYGIQHPEKYFVVFSGKWDEDYSLDKAELNRQKIVLSDSKKLVRNTYNLALKLRDYPAKKVTGRINRT